MLHAADGPYGVERDQLLRAVGYDAADAADLLQRDIRQLKDVGWRIDTLGGEGERARYRLVPGDPRLRVHFSDAERRALRRAAAMAGATDTREMLRAAGSAPDATSEPSSAAILRQRPRPQHLDSVLAALRDRAELRFRYNGRDRVVHPYEVTARGGSWICIGFEPSSGVTKTFDVARMTQVSTGTARAFDSPMTPMSSSLDTLSWQVDPPVDAVVETEPAYVPDVERSLGSASARVDDRGRCRLTIPVTNRLVFRARLLSLGPRVRLVGPADLRSEVVATLRAAVRGADA